MLFAPEFHQGIGQPAAVGAQAVDDGVAGRADGDQPGGVVDAGAAVVDHTLVPCPAPPAPMPVPVENGFAPAGKVP